MQATLEAEVEVQTRKDFIEGWILLRKIQAENKDDLKVELILLIYFTIAVLNRQFQLSRRRDLWTDPT